MKRAILLCALALLCALPVWAGEGSDPTTPLTVDAVGGHVHFAAAHAAVWFKNDGAKDAIVRVFTGCETVADILTTDTAAHAIKPGESWGTTFDPRECAGGQAGSTYTGFAYIANAAESTTIRWFAK